jgi:hypothetical protein
MALYYYTTDVEDPAVYHNNQQCSEGKKIKSEHRVDTDTRPSDRRLCKVC